MDGSVSYFLTSAKLPKGYFLQSKKITRGFALLLSNLIFETTNFKFQL